MTTMMYCERYEDNLVVGEEDTTWLCMHFVIPNDSDWRGPTNLNSFGKLRWRQAVHQSVKHDLNRTSEELFAEGYHSFVNYLDSEIYIAISNEKHVSILSLRLSDRYEYRDIQRGQRLMHKSSTNADFIIGSFTYGDI